LFCSEDGIVTTITIWQWILEFILNIAFIIFVNTFLGLNKFLDQTLGILTAGINLIILPGFYLLADHQFRLEVIDHGFFKALWVTIV
jgi:hypothetical protein